MNDVSLIVAFGAGLISFLSPCVLPLVPGYVSFITGVSFGDLTALPSSNSFLRREKRVVLLNSIFFIAGFSLVFILLGATATVVGNYLSSKISIFSKIAGGVIIFFGIYKMGLIRSHFFFKEVRFQINAKKFGYAGALLIGAAFAFGWTPCIGPILAGILTYAGTLDSANQGISLLMVYSLGLGIPFLLAAFGINHFLEFFSRIKKYIRLIEVTSGVILVILGLMIFFNKLILLPGYLSFLNRFSL